MEVSTPIFQIGYKGDPMPNGAETLRVQLLGELAIQAMVGPSSLLYQELYEQGLINNRFDCGCELYPGCVFLYAGGESRDPRTVSNRLKEEAQRLVRDGIDEGLWERLKKAAYGNRVRALNSFENLCVGHAQSFFTGADALDFPGEFDRLTRQEAQQLLKRWVVDERTTLSVVRPREGV